MRERARREVQMAEVEDERTKHKIEEKHVNQESIIKVSNSKGRGVTLRRR
jgi:hypothetical protein